MKEFAYIHEEGKLPDLLAHIPFFEQFTAGHLNDILYSSYFIQCDPGDRVIQQGQEDKRIFVLLTGQLEVVKDGEHVATIEKNGEIFGEVAVVTGERRIATVVARKPTLCLVIDQQFLQELKPEGTNAGYYAALYGFLSRVMAARLRAVSERLAEVERELDLCRSGAPPAGKAKRLAKPASRLPAKKPASRRSAAVAVHQPKTKTSRKK